MQRTITEIEPMEEFRQPRVRVTVREPDGIERSFIVEGLADIEAAYREAGFDPFPRRQGRAGAGTTPQRTSPMTTSVIVRPAGHHVRVTTIAPAVDGVTSGMAEPFDMAPGDAERTFYVHGSISLKVEEYTPEAQPDGVTDEDEPHDEISSDDGDYEASKA